MNKRLPFLILGAGLFATSLLFVNCQGRVLSGEITDMGATEFAEVIHKGDSVIILDVESDELGDVIITRAIACPITNENDAKAVVKKYGTKKPFAVYDDNGTKSQHAAKHIAEQGGDVYHLDSGIVGWIDGDNIVMIMPIEGVTTEPMQTKKSDMMKNRDMMKKMSKINHHKSDGKMSRIDMMTKSDKHASR